MPLVQKMLFKEILIPFLFSFLGLSLFLTIGKLFSFLDTFIIAGAGMGEIPKLIWLMLPALWAFIIPMAALLGILLAFLRLSRDNEIIALLASGIRPLYLIKPVAIVSFVLFIANLLITIYLFPAANASVKEYLVRITETILSKGLPEKTFFSPIPGLTLYVHEAHNGGKNLKGVFIRDAREEKASGEGFAKEGDFFADPETKQMVLRLKEGTILRVSNDLSVRDNIRFDEYVLKLTLGSASRKISRGEMTLSELNNKWNNPETPKKKKILCKIEFIKRFAIPLGTIILGLLAMPLGIIFGRTGPSGGTAIGLMAYLTYYLATAFAANAARSTPMSPFIVMWIPDIIFLAMAVALIFYLEKRGPVRWR